MNITDIIPAGVPWLTLLVILPALGALAIGVIRPLREIGRPLALIIAVAELVLAIVAAVSFDWASPAAYQLVESYPWIAQIGVTWSLGANALGLVMILLATALVPLVLLAAWREGDEKDAGSYAALVLCLEAFMVLIFAAFDVVVFYIAFEAMLIPLYFMIGRFGSGEPAARQKAAVKFVIYSLVGGLAMLGGLVALWANVEHTDTAFRLDTLSSTAAGLSSGLQLAVFLTFMLAFAIKAPMVPLHTWLADVAAEARPGTSVLLVGVLDKIGTFGMITLCLRLFPEACAKAAPVILVLAVVSILWGGLAAIGQKDLMRLVSFTSVSHFGFMVLGIFIGSEIALIGSMFYMVAHGVSIAALFLISGFLTERGGTREIAHYRGMQRITPVIAGTFLTAGLASVALPGLSGFVPEYLVFMGTWKVSPALAIFAVLGVVLAALYILMPYQKIFTGPPSEGPQLADMDGREKTVVTPLIIAMLVLGIWSAPLVGALQPLAAEGAEMIEIGQAAARLDNEGDMTEEDVTGSVAPDAADVVAAPAAAAEGSAK